MRRMRSFVKIRRRTDLGKTFEELETDVKTEVDDIATTETSARWKSFNFVPEDDKVIISSSVYSKPIIEDLKNYPLGMKHRHLNRYVYLDFTGELIDTFQHAIDVAGVLADRLTELSGLVYIVELKDKVNRESTKTVLPSIFSSSRYVSEVEDVVVSSDVVYGAANMPTEWNDISPECVETAAPGVSAPADSGSTGTSGGTSGSGTSGGTGTGTGGSDNFNDDGAIF